MSLALYAARFLTFSAFNADFDGDEMNLFVARSITDIEGTLPLSEENEEYLEEEDAVVPDTLIADLD